MATHAGPNLESVPNHDAKLSRHQEENMSYFDKRALLCIRTVSSAPQHVLSTFLGMFEQLPLHDGQGVR